MEIIATANLSIVQWPSFRMPGECVSVRAHHAHHGIKRRPCQQHLQSITVHWRDCCQLFGTLSHCEPKMPARYSYFIRIWLHMKIKFIILHEAKTLELCVCCQSDTKRKKKKRMVRPMPFESRWHVQTDSTALIWHRCVIHTRMILHFNSSSYSSHFRCNCYRTWSEWCEMAHTKNMKSSPTAPL